MCVLSGQTLNQHFYVEILKTYEKQSHSCEEIDCFASRQCTHSQLLSKNINLKNSTLFPRCSFVYPFINFWHKRNPIFLSSGFQAKIENLLNTLSETDIQNCYQQWQHWMQKHLLNRTTLEVITSDDYLPIVWIIVIFLITI